MGNLRHSTKLQANELSRTTQVSTMAYNTSNWLPLLPATGLLFGFLAIAGCGNQAKEVDWLKEDGSYCTPDPQQRSENCYIQPEDDDDYEVKIKNKEDLSRICDATCGKIRYLRVAAVEGLRDLKALTGIKIEESATISSNPNLETTEGLRMSDGSGVRFEYNRELEKISGFEEVETSSSFVLEDSPQVEELSTLSNVEKIEGGEDFTARFRMENTGVKDLQPLDGVTFGSGTWLYLLRNRSLEKLPDINGEIIHITLQTNERLTDIDGLKNLSKVHGSFSVINNKSLKSCHAQEVADAIDFHEESEIRIRDNASGSCTE